MSTTQITSTLEEPASISERARAKESLRYASIFLEKSRRLDFQSVTERASCVRPCVDTGLTALAQIGTLKLNVSRCMISLFDRRHQHVIAETTQTSPLDYNTQDQSGDRKLWLCGTALPRSTEYPSEALLTSTPSQRLPVLVVPDILKDDRWSGKVFVKKWPSIHFYAGVPIVSKNGIRIGTYTVFDVRPRDGLNEEEQQFLRDISDTTMRYLQSRVSIDSIHRGERMVRGLGSFVEGKASINSSDNGQIGDAAGQLEERLNVKRQSIQREDNEIEADFGQQSPELFARRADYVQKRPELPRLETATWSTTTGTRSTVTSSCQTSATSPFFTKPTSSTAPDFHVMELKRAFSRASNILRETVELEGVLFLDASISSFGGMVEDRGHSGACGHSNDQSRRGSQDTLRYCDILGLSTTESSSIEDLEMSRDQMQVPERLMRKLLSRYPEGKIYNFDLDGAYLSGESDASDCSTFSRSNPDGTVKSRRRPSRVFQSLEGQARAITHIFPDARSVAVVPLWDSVKERWFACGLLWTNSPTRIFTVEGELSFLRAFGTTIMAEVQRLNALMSEKAKSDFLGSLSHELRSPLHGMLGAVELLNDTNIDAFQGDAVHTVETSGRTLLDTLDHLLDHSKINTYLNSAKLAREGSRASSIGSMQTDSGEMPVLMADVQLDLLVEEVAESVLAGYSFQRKSVSQLMGEKPPHEDRQAHKRLDSISAIEGLGPDLDASSLSACQSGNVLCYLDIDPTVVWDFRVQPGSVRRIVLNLLGNSLKFTKHGFIWISLRQRDIPAHNAWQNSHKIILTISDSGKGISEEYLRNQLFLPFQQENSLTPGTGLGLSLVRQVATTLGGCVTLTSQLGRGTTAQVTLPMTRSVEVIDREKDLLGHLEELRGSSICLRGFDHCYERVIEETSEQPSAVSEAAVMEMLCRDWLGMRIIPICAVEEERPDLFLFSEQAFADPDGRDIAIRLSIPTVIVCRDAFTARSLAKSPVKAWTTEFISQPVGHRRLARSLALCQSRRKQGSASSTPMESRGGTPRPEPQGPASSRKGPSNAVTNVPEVKLKAPTKSDDVPCCPEVEAAKFEIITKTTQEESWSELLPDLPSPQMESGQAKASAGPRKYLLVDDNDINLRILASFMKKLGYEYDTASNGLQALKMYSESPGLYPFVLMDISMPVMDGLEATRRIREHEQSKDIIPATVIALTGLASSSVQREATAKGMNVFLTKPVSLAGLKGILASFDKNDAAA